jgi:hypothetical protein
MSQTSQAAIAAVGIDIGKNSFHVVGLDERGAIVLRQKWSRSQVESRFANIPSCLIVNRPFNCGLLSSIFETPSLGSWSFPRSPGAS